MSRVREFLARRDAVAQLAVVLGAVGAYELARLAMEPNWAQAFANANRIESVEEVLGFAWEQSLQRAFLALPDLVAALNLFYFVGHFLLTGIFFVWLYHRSRDGFSSFRDGFLAATALGARHPLALSDRAAAARRRRARGHPAAAVRDRHRLAAPPSALSNPVAAVPSLHAAYALGVGIGMIRYARSHV